jgi:hypothetical protein
MVVILIKEIRFMKTVFRAILMVECGKFLSRRTNND